jgi:uncharacterized RDD family membrane protein YckC
LDERFIAWLIDIIILWVSLSWFSWPGFSLIPKAWETIVPRGIPIVDLGFKNVIYFLYWTLLEWKYGQSVGKMAMRIKVTHLNGGPICSGRAAIQSIGKAFLLPLDCIIGWIMYPAKEQRLFNYISETVAVKIIPIERKYTSRARGPKIGG